MVIDQPVTDILSYNCVSVYLLSDQGVFGQNNFTLSVQETRPEQRRVLNVLLGVSNINILLLEKRKRTSVT